jgi:outer membrane beta-barrel protein
MSETNMKRWFKALSAGLLALAAVASAPKSAQAQEIQLTGPLAGAPAVRKLRLYREGRFEIAPTVSFTLLDEYRRTIFAGARLNYNLTEWAAIGVYGAYGAASLATDLTTQVDSKAPLKLGPGGSITNPNVGESFDAQTARLQWIAAPQLTLVPFRGKLALFEKAFVDTDAYIHVGAAAVGVKERKDCGTDSTKCSENFETASRVAIAPTFGLGLTFYPSDLVSFGFEYRALPFSWNRAGFDTRGSGTDGKFPDGKINSDDRTFKFNQMVSIFVGFSLGDRKTSE